jgi:hypothetical protein
VNGDDVPWVRGRVFNLLPQLGDVIIHGAGEGKIIIAPHVVKQFLVSLDDVLDQREAEPAAFPVMHESGTDPVKLVEYPGVLRARYAYALIRDLNRYMPVAQGNLDVKLLSYCASRMDYATSACIIPAIGMLYDSHSHKQCGRQVIRRGVV